MQGFIAVNGRISPAAEAVVPALDRGLLFGDAVFEVLVAFGGKLLDTAAHLGRLRASAEVLGFPIPWGDEELEFEMSAMVERLAVPKAYLRLVVSRGSGVGLKPDLGLTPNRLVYCLPAAVEPKATYLEGLGLKRLLKGSTTRGAAPKTGANYVQSVMGMERARQEGFDDVLWTNADGEITEASTANIFFLAREGDSFELITPPAASGILLGITRATLIRLMTQARLPVREHVVFADELPRFDEAFLCSTVRGLVPVSRIDKHKLHAARAGSAFRHIERLFLTWTESQIGVRVDWATGRPTPRAGG